MERTLNKLIVNFLKREQFRFIIVGCLNTAIGTTVMFVAYYLGLGYWISTALNYIVGSIFSYFANKHFTFHSKKKDRKELFRFVVNIVVCYFIAYGVAKPIIIRVLGSGNRLIDYISMILGMMIFIVINYLGQKFYVFRRQEDERYEHKT